VGAQASSDDEAETGSRRESDNMHQSNLLHTGCFQTFCPPCRTGGDNLVKRMRPMEDHKLLQEYVGCGSETAFRTLVERHLNMVHSVAMRQVNDLHLAEEVSQAVFILLARKARSFRSGVLLSGWLFRTTRFVAARAVRSEQRRRNRDQEAFHM
jgi:hypothetical protein